MNLTDYIVLGVYTVIYLIVFLIQRSQIKKQKDVTESMERFMNIFKVDEVEKYTEMVLKSRNAEITDLKTQISNTTDNEKKIEYYEGLVNLYQEGAAIKDEIISTQKETLEKKDEIIKIYEKINKDIIINS